MKIRDGYVGNSSSSCFICNTDLSFEEIQKILNKLLEVWNLIEGSSLSYNDVFSGPFVGTQRVTDDLQDYQQGIDVNGKTIIESEYDNSIPYPLFDLIEHAFDAERIHLG